MSNKPNIQETKRSASTLQRFLEAPSVMEQIQRALPKHLTVERLLRQALTLCQLNTGLLECSDTSILAGIMKSAELGLELNGVLGQSYLVPRWNSQQKCKEATFQVGWRGLANLAFRTGKVGALPLRLVHARDAFLIKYGSFQHIEHTPCLEGDPGPVVGYYACIELTNGGRDFEFMTVLQAEEFRDRYRASKGDYSPWTTNFDDMALKTCLRKLAKRVPLSAEFQDAAVSDEYGEAGVLPGPAPRELGPPRSEAILAQLDSQAGNGETAVLDEPEQEPAS